MAMIVPSPNLLLASVEDKLGHMLSELKTRLVATGCWRVRGSGQGAGGGTFQLMGQTAGVDGSFDVFTAAQQWLPYCPYNINTWWAIGPLGSMSHYECWFILEEISTGRVFSFKRGPGNDYGVVQLEMKVAAGCASSGATANTLPAMTGLIASWTNNIQSLVTSNTPESAHAVWFQFGYSSTPDENGVCPFWIALWNRTTNVPSWGLLYESLDIVPGGCPFVVGMGDWTAGGGMFGSELFATEKLSTLYNAVPITCRLTALSVNGAARPVAPPTNVQPLGIDSKWRAIRPPVNDSGGRWLGQCKNILTHPINREYPTTYGLMSAEPWLALGQILVPWKTGVAPQSSP